MPLFPVEGWIPVMTLRSRSPHDAITKRSRPKVIYAETYRLPGLRIKQAFLPTLPNAVGFVVDSAFILKAGAVTIDGKEFEFQDVRIYLAAKTPAEGDPTP